MNASTRFLIIMITLCASAVLFAPTASAADPTAGDKVVIPLGKKGKGLRVKGVKIRAIKPAKLVGSTVSLPVSTITLPRGTEGQIVLRGGFQLVSGRRKVAIQGLMVKLVGSKLTITGKAGSSRYQLFSGKAGGSS